MANNEESNLEALNSAMLTATLKSLQILNQIHHNQTKLIDQQTQLRDVQARHSDQLTKIEQRPESPILGELKASLDKIEQQMAQFDVHQLMEQQQSQNKALQQMILNKIDELKAQATTNSNQEAMVVLKRLVDGLRNMNSNTKMVANRVEHLSTNVQGICHNTNQLTATINDTNHRITKMDLRVGALIANPDLSAEDLAIGNLDTDAAIKLLNQYEIDEPNATQLRETSPSDDHPVHNSYVANHDTSVSSSTDKVDSSLSDASVSLSSDASVLASSDEPVSSSTDKVDSSSSDELVSSSSDKPVSSSSNASVISAQPRSSMSTSSSDSIATAHHSTRPSHLLNDVNDVMIDGHAYNASREPNLTSATVDKLDNIDELDDIMRDFKNLKTTESNHQHHPMQAEKGSDDEKN